MGSNLLRKPKRNFETTSETLFTIHTKNSCLNRVSPPSQWFDFLLLSGIMGLKERKPMSYPKSDYVLASPRAENAPRSEYEIRKVLEINRVMDLPLLSNLRANEYEIALRVVSR